MSTSEPDFEHLLRQAIQKAKDSAPRAVADLHHFSSKAAEAVDRGGGSARGKACGHPLVGLLLSRCLQTKNALIVRSGGGLAL